MATAQTKYIGIGTAIISISLLISWFASRPDFKVDFSPNISCSGECVNPIDSDCVQFFNITSLSKKFYIRNSGNFNLPFTYPEKIKSFQIYRADIRFRTDNPSRWKPINLSKGLTLEVNKTNEFRINLCKNNPADVVKWGIQGMGIDEDPLFDGSRLYSIQKCDTKIYYKPTYSKCQKPYYSYTYVNNISGENEIRTKTIDSDCVASTIPETIKECVIIGYNYSGKILDFSESDFRCRLDGTIISCDSVYDGNGDGVCISGESCIKINTDNFLIDTRFDRRGFKQVKIR